MALVVGIGVGSFALSGHGTTPPTPTQLASANLTANGRTLGEVLVAPGHPAWVFMTIDRGSASGVVWCELTLSGGRVETVGRFTLSGGYASWGAPVHAPAGQVRGARLVTANGTVVASATLPA